MYHGMTARHPQSDVAIGMGGTKTQSAVATGRQAIRVGGTKTQSAVATGNQAIQGCKHQPAVAIRVGGTTTLASQAIHGSTTQAAVATGSQAIHGSTEHAWICPQIH